MSEPARQSYYEIALTNRQVLSVFVILLVSVLTAFLAGVWLGRRAAGPAVETVQAQTITAATEPAEEPLERLEFFNRDQAATALEPVDAPVDPPVDSPESAEPQVAESGSPGPAEEGPAGLVATPEESEPEPQITARAEPPPVATVAESSPPAAGPQPPPAAPSGGSLVVQVFSSSNQVQAQGVVDRLRAGGFPALLSPVEVSGRTMYRVRIGPYADRQVAEGIAEQVRRDYRLETWITE